MKPERKSRIVHYKRAQFSSGEITLQDMLANILNDASPFGKACNRHEQINQDVSDSILINHHKTFNGMLFGQLIFIEYGKAQSFLSLDKESNEYVIEPLTLDSISKSESESETTKQRQFVDSILYFGVIENHIAVVQSRSLTARNLEQHLNWLLVQAGQLNNGNIVILKDTASADVREKLEKSSAKSLIIGAPLHSEQKSQAVLATDIIHAEKVSFGLYGKGADILKKLIGADIIEGMSLEDALDNKANLKMHVVLTYDRKTSESGQKVLDTVAASMRHMPDDDFQIKLKSGATIKGNELRISDKLNIEMINGTVNESGLCTQMQLWLHNNVKQVL